MDTVLKLRELRARAGLTQEEVARRSGVGAKTLSYFESGARIDSMKLSQLRAILAVYALTEADFFSASLARSLDPFSPPLAPADALAEAVDRLPGPAQRVVLEKIQLAIELAGALQSAAA